MSISPLSHVTPAITDLFTIFVISYFQKVTQLASFSLWISEINSFSLALYLEIHIQVAAWIGNPVLLWSPPPWLGCMNEFDRSSVGGRVGCFQALAATKKAVSAFMHKFLCGTHITFSGRNVQEPSWLCGVVLACWVFKETASIFWSGCTVPYHPSNVTLRFPTSWPGFGGGTVLFFHSDKCIVIARGHFVYPWWCWTSFHVLICHLCYLFIITSVPVFCPFSDWVFFLTVKIWELFIYLVLNTNSLWDTWFVRFFFPSVCSLSFSFVNRIFLKFFPFFSP